MASAPSGRIEPPADDVLALIDTVFAAQQNPAFTNIALACPQTSDFYPGGKLGRMLSSQLRRRPDLIGQYPLPPGSLRLRQQIARRSMTLGMLLEPGDVVLTHGCMEALQLALRVTTKPGDCVGLESPTYFYLLPLLASLGLKALEIPTDPQLGLSLDALELLLNEKRLNAVIAMPTVQNPLGCTMPLAAKKRLARLMNDHQVPLIEDGLYAEIQFGGALSPAVKAFDRDGWVLFCSSFTKTLAPDFRVGWICGGRFHEALRKLKAVSSMSESQLLSETLATFLESGGYDHHLRNLRKRYAAQVDEARALIARHFRAARWPRSRRAGSCFGSNFPRRGQRGAVPSAAGGADLFDAGHFVFAQRALSQRAAALLLLPVQRALHPGVGPARRQGLRDERPAARHCARRVTARAFCYNAGIVD